VAGAWNLAFTDELEHFPVGGHDDMVDAASGAFAWLARTAGGVGYRGAEQRRRAPGFRV
jgi:phage terminase large subunit-like protein